MGYSVRMLEYHLAVMCSPAQRRAPFLDCDFIVGNLVGDKQQDVLVEARTGQRTPLRPGARERFLLGDFAVDVSGMRCVACESPAAWYLGKRSPALSFMMTLIEGLSEERRLDRHSSGFVFVGPGSLSCRLVAARLALTMTKDAVASGMKEAAEFAEVAYALSVPVPEDPEAALAWRGATRDPDFYGLVARAYAVSGTAGMDQDALRTLFEPAADRGTRELVDLSEYT
jgi:hypothetical protein